MQTAKTLLKLKVQFVELAIKARDNKLTIADMTGGSFTITNGGVFGSLMSTPILNGTQVGILGMHTIQRRPVAVGDNVEIRPMMYVALSYDHRVIDGKDSVGFLKMVKELIENPEDLLTRFIIKNRSVLHGRLIYSRVTVLFLIERRVTITMNFKTWKKHQL